MIQLHEWLTTSLVLDIWKEDKKMSHLIFDVSSGVDEELLARNLSALANLPKVLFMQDDEPVKTFTTYYFVANVLLAWFVAMGISVREVRDWLTICISSHYEEWETEHTGLLYSRAETSLAKLYEFFQKMEQSTPTFKEPTLFPLPSFIDVRYFK
jgi:hypothetical protein